MIKNIKLGKGRAGFTLVEILVVMAIISILLAIAVPAILKTVQVTRENASAASAHNLAIASFNYANDNNSTYPTGATSTAIFNTLYAGRYLQTGRDVYLSPNNGKTPYVGTTPTVTVTANNNCWDYTVVSATQGIYGTEPTGLPLLMSDTGSLPTLASGVVNATVTGTSTWGLDGVTIAYVDQAAKFAKPIAAGTVPLTTVDFQIPSGSTYSMVAP